MLFQTLTDWPTKLGEKFADKYTKKNLLKLAEDKKTSNEEVKEIIARSSDNFTTKTGTPFFQALDDDNIYVNLSMKYGGGWKSWVFGSEIVVDPLVFNPSVPQEVRDKYTQIPEQIQNWMRKNARSLGLSGGPWVIQLP
jgi:hypothetical protein